METSFPIITITIIGAFIGGLTLGGFVVAVISETLAARRAATMIRDHNQSRVAWNAHIARLNEMVANLEQKIKARPTINSVVAKIDTTLTADELAHVAREAFLQRGPEYRQLGPLAFVKFEHLALLRRMGWILRQGTGAPAPGWMITNHDDEMVLESDDITDLMRRATDLGKQSNAL